MLAGTPLGLTGCAGPFSTLHPAGPSAATAAMLWWGMFVLFSLVFVAVCGLWLYAMFRSPSIRDEAQEKHIHRRWIIGGGLVLPLACIVVLLAFGIPAGHSMLPLPPDEGEALEVHVTARQWHWDVHYPDGDISLSNEVHIPAGRPVDVHVTSVDVIHSFWVPRLGGKLDAIPGRTNVLRLQADAPGSYRGQCAEFCGTGHAHMHFTVIAHDPEDFDAWRTEAAGND
ncbi:cytochrome c oxidase subunit II [Thioalkalivibrio denitrificans]|uniref:cytochrome-c oxidase n=1 Tax=Thioalkalivibrio denitrificans TaxID=108003 RepID=A0A1V3N882_9GAMM|nr:cytochrome c oxidase subunit II [Thioalkalivibrio denitrificans]OOG21016.1 cytochrome c oxidase subunit II [Thioalkalivibrio denitrificans]